MTLPRREAWGKQKDILNWYAIDLWNSLPQGEVMTTSIDGFKRSRHMEVYRWLLAVTVGSNLHGPEIRVFLKSSLEGAGHSVDC